MELHVVRASRRMRIFGIVGALFVVTLGVVWGVSWYMAKEQVAIPASVTEKLAFKPHSPRLLPERYAIDTTSAMLDEGALAYVAKDGAGGQIVFSEQPKPSEQKVNDFIDENAPQSYFLSDTPHTSILGKSIYGGYTLSVVTDTTWLIISSQSSQAEENLRFIAHQL
jgi:hypothetical protein